MKRLSRRNLERALRAPAPEPPPELGPRIKEQIPDDLFAARAAEPPMARRSGGRVALAMAASVVAAIGSGYLAVRLFDRQPDARPELAAVDVASEPEARAPAREELRATEPAVAAAAPPAAPPAPRPDVADAAEASKPEAARASKHEATEAPEPRAAEASETANESVQALSRQARVLKRVADDGASVPVDALLDAAASGGAADGAAVSLGAIEVEGTMTRTPGRVAVLVSAVVASSSPDQEAPGADAIVLELDPAVASGHRLLARDARALPPAAPGARGGDAGTLYRLSALYEIELASASDASAVLGTVRLRGAATEASRSMPRAIDRDQLAARWDEASGELKLAVLAAEVALLPADAPPALLAPLRRDLERLLAEASLDPAAARRAESLLAIASRPTAAGDGSATQPAAAPVRDDG